jgi:hypothetical protein
MFHPVQIQLFAGGEYMTIECENIGPHTYRFLGPAHRTFQLMKNAKIDIGGIEDPTQ